MKTEEELILESYEDNNSHKINCPTSILKNAGILTSILENVNATAHQISMGNYNLNEYINEFLDLCEMVSDGRRSEIMQVSSDMKSLYNRQKKY